MVRSRVPRRKRAVQVRCAPRVSQPCPYSQSAASRAQLVQPHHPSSPHPISLEEFTNLVAEALDTLPQEIIEKLENVAVTVEEQASPDVLAEMGLTNPRELLGAYRGIPRPWRSMFAPLSDFPDKIEIYYWPIVRACPYPHEIKEIVRRVVVHEVGHHFGMSDQQLRALGY